MPEFAKSGMMGGYKVLAVGEDSMEWTHAVLPRKEFFGMKEDVWKANRDANAAVANADARIKRMEAQATAQIQKAKADVAAQIEGLQDALEEQRAAAEYYKGLNETLLWMNKKRANAERDLRPKTEHTGYAVLSSVEKELAYYVRKKRQTVLVWETTLQTPFAVDFTEDQVRQETQWLHKNENGWLIGKLGINSVWEATYEDILAHKDGQEYLYNRNTWFRTRYRINAKEGYWELLITHSKCITGIPPEMMPAQKNKKKAGNKKEAPADE